MAGKQYTQEQINKAGASKPEVPGLSDHLKVTQDALAPAEAVVLPAPEPEQQKPSYFGEIIPAAARVSNWTYGAYHDTLESEHHDIDLNYKAADHLTELRKDVPEAQWPRLFKARSLAGALKERKDILAELEDKKTLEKGGLLATATEFGMMVADVPAIVGGFGEAYALGNMLTKGARLANFAKAGTAGALAAVGQEAALQSTTHTRDTSDLVYAGVFGATVGGALGAFSKQGKDLSRDIMHSMDLKLAAETPMEYTTRDAAQKIATAEHEAAQVALDKSIPESVPTVSASEAINTRTDELLAANKKLVDEHTAKRVQAEQRSSRYTPQDNTPTFALHVPDTIDVYDELGKMATEYVNGIKGSYKQIVQNDGSTLAMFVPWVDNGKSGVKRVTTAGAEIESVAAKEVAVVADEVQVPKQEVPTKPEVLDAAGNVVPPSRDLLQETLDMEAAGVFNGAQDTMTARTLSKVGFTDSAFMMGQKSPVSRYIDHILLSSASGSTSSAGTAAIRKFQHLKVMLSTFMPELSASYKQFAQENNISHWNLKKYYGEGMENWNKELRYEMESRRNAFRDGIEHQSTAVQHIQDAADSLQRAADYSLDLAKASGVRGFEDIVRQPGYVPLIWSGKALRKLGKDFSGPLQRSEQAAYEALLSKGYTNALGLTTKDADTIAKAVIRRALHKDLGLDANPRSLFSGDSRGFLRQTLEEGNLGLSEQKINELFARIDARQGDNGMSSRAKRRTDIDLLVQDSEGRSLLNIVDNDVPMLFNRYASEMSGRSALAHAGITSEADWTRLRELAITTASDYGDDVNKLKKVLDSTYDQFLGRPAGGGVNKNVRRIMDLATVASLGQVGFAQMAEWAPIMAAHGIGGMFEVLPEVKAYRKALLNGTLDSGVLSELHPLMGRIGDEERLFRPDIRLDDKLSDDPAWLRILDKGLGTLNDVSGKLSLMHQIKTMQQQFVVLMQANKVAKAVQKGEWKKLSARFGELGWDEQFMKELQGVSKHFEFEGGTLQRLNIQNWHNPVMEEKFIQGLHIHTNQMIQMQMIGETAYWMHPTIGAMLTQFRTFPLVAMEKQTARHMRMADEEAVFTAMYGLGLSSMVYTAKVGFKSLGKGSDKQQYLDDHLSIDAISKGALQYANIAGPIQDISNLAVAAGLAPKIMSSSNVGRTGGQKQANLSIADVPSLGTGLKIFNAATGLGKGLLDPSYNYSKRDLQNIQGGMPLGNTPFLAIPWNIAKDSIE